MIFTSDIDLKSLKQHHNLVPRPQKPLMLNMNGDSISFGIFVPKDKIIIKCKKLLKGTRVAPSRFLKCTFSVFKWHKKTIIHNSKIHALSMFWHSWCFSISDDLVGRCFGGINFLCSRCWRSPHYWRSPQMFCHSFKLQGQYLSVVYVLLWSMFAVVDV